MLCIFDPSLDDGVMTPLNKADRLAELKMDILRFQGFNSTSNSTVDLGLGPIKQAFPNGTFPLGAVHEFLSTGAENSAASSGFIAALIASLMEDKSAALWISSSRTLFPPALSSFGIQPDRFIFVDLQKEKDAIWVMEEALKCSALSAVIGEIREIDFTTSRRLQLAVEQSQVNGFILRNNFRHLNTTACISRWKIIPLPSDPFNNLPGIGFPKWRAELLRMRNGKSGMWDIQWREGRFEAVQEFHSVFQEHQKKTG